MNLIEKCFPLARIDKGIEASVKNLNRHIAAPPNYEPAPNATGSWEGPNSFMFEWNNSEYLANVPQAISSGSRSRLPASNASTSMNTAGRTLARGGMVQRAPFTQSTPKT